jgi:sugar lactone lactonase YvrE
VKIHVNASVRATARHALARNGTGDRSRDRLGGMTQPPILVTGLGYPESPRWRDGRLWLANWGTQEVVAVDPAGTREVVTTVPTTIPYSIDWDATGRLLIVAGQQARLLRLEPDGSLVTHADLSPFGAVFNEIVVDGRGNAYVNGSDIVLVTPDGAVRRVAEGLAFGNGMAVTPDNATLIVAESYGRQLTAFDIRADGGLANCRLWAEVAGPPDGICVDADGAIWYADVPNRRCVRVREGGEVLDTVTVDRGCFACMLGGPDGRTLFILAAQWLGMDHLDDVGRSGLVYTVDAPAPAAGWP